MIKVALIQGQAKDEECCIKRFNLGMCKPGVARVPRIKNSESFCVGVAPNCYYYKERRRQLLLGHEGDA